MILKAKSPILYWNKQYEIGDTLPASDSRMVDAWLEAGTAAWVDNDEAPPAEPAKGRLAAAEPGLPGLSSDGDPEALVGRVPKRQKKAVKK